MKYNLHMGRSYWLVKQREKEGEREGEVGRVEEGRKERRKGRKEEEEEEEREGREENEMGGVKIKRGRKRKAGRKGEGFIVCVAWRYIPNNPRTLVGVFYHSGTCTLTEHVYLWD